MDGPVIWLLLDLPENGLLPIALTWMDAYDHVWYIVPEPHIAFLLAVCDVLCNIAFAFLPVYLRYVAEVRHWPTLDFKFHEALKMRRTTFAEFQTDDGNTADFWNFGTNDILLFFSIII